VHSLPSLCALLPSVVRRTSSVLPSVSLRPRVVPLLVGGELKHIRPALDSGSIANGGEFVVPSRPLWRALVSPREAPRTSSPFLEYQPVLPFGKGSACPSRFDRLPMSLSYTRETRHFGFPPSRPVPRPRPSLFDDRTSTLGISVRSLAEAKPITCAGKTSATTRDTRISVIHIYEGGEHHRARGIKINGREGLMRARAIRSLASELTTS